MRPRQNCSRIVIAALLALTGAASAQIRVPCGFDAKCFDVNFILNHSYSISASGCNGGVQTWAAAYDLTSSMPTGADPGPCGFPTDSTNMFYNADADNKSSGPAGCYASCSAGPTNYGGYGAATVNWGCTSGTTYVNTHSRFCSETYSFNGVPYLYRNTLGMGSAGGGGQKVFTVSGPVSFLSTIAPDIDIDFTGGSASTNTPLAHSGFWVSETVQGSSTPARRQGLYVFPSDSQTPVPLGFFADLGLQPSPTPTGYTLQFTSTFAPTVTNNGTVTYTLAYDFIPAFDGNMNPSTDGTTQMVCYADRAILHSLLGSTIGDGVYNPRADLNQDGQITQADIAIFNTLPCNANWDCSTTPPRLNSNDFSAFMNSFAAADPAADVNGDGNLNSLDYGAFLNAYAAGCP